jgi:uncharacterized protein
MADRDKKHVVVAPGGPDSKPRAGAAARQDCGDIGLRIARDGTWYYQGSSIGRQSLVKLFASVLTLGEDGRHYLVTPVEKVSIEVEDAPFVAVAMDAEGEREGQLLRFRTNLDEVVAAGSDHALTFRGESDGSFTPFVIVRDGLKARLLRPVYYDLIAAAVERGDELGVWSGGVFFPFPASQQ